MPIRIAVMMALILPALASAPAPPPPAAAGTYTIELTLTHTLNGQTPEIRQYELRVSPGGHGDKLNLGARVPMETGKDQFTYQQVGVSLDCSLRTAAAADQVELMVHAELRSVATAPAPSTLLPRLNSVTLDTDSDVPLGRAVRVATAAGPAAGETYRLEARVTVTAPAS